MVIIPTIIMVVWKLIEIALRRYGLLLVGFLNLSFVVATLAHAFF